MPTISGDFFFGSEPAVPSAPHVFRIERVFGAELLRSGKTEAAKDTAKDRGDRLQATSPAGGIP